MLNCRMLMGSALLAAIVVVACGKSNSRYGVTRRELMPVHPTTGAAAALALRAIDHFGYTTGEEPVRTPKPLLFAAWLDGTMIWTDSTLEADPRAYKITHGDPAAVRELVQRCRTRFDALPERVMGLPWVVCSAGAEQQVALLDGDAYFAVSWGGEKDTALYPVVAPVWRDVRMLVDAAIPIQGDVIALNQIR